MKLKVLGIVILVVVLVHALFAFVLMRHGNEGGGEEPIVEKDLENDTEKPNFQYGDNAEAPAAEDSGLPEANYYGLARERDDLIRRGGLGDAFAVGPSDGDDNLRVFRKLPKTKMQ